MSQSDRTLVDSILLRIRNHPVAAWMIVGTAFVIALSQFVGAVDKLQSFFQPKDTRASALPTPSTPAPITISYELGRMLEGRAVVYIANREVGNLFVDESEPQSSISITLPRSGAYEYSIQGRMRMMGFLDELRMPFETDSNGRGTVEVEPGKEFLLTTNNVELHGGGRNTWYATLTDKALQRK